jgi:hypothetical protein
LYENLFRLFQFAEKLLFLDLLSSLFTSVAPAAGPAGGCNKKNFIKAKNF